MNDSPPSFVAADAAEPDVTRTPWLTKRSAWEVVIRVGEYVGLLLAVVVVAAVVPRLMPGDPITALWSVGSDTFVYDETVRARLRARFGLDVPLPVQVIRDVGGMLTGDLGVSIRYGEPVMSLLGRRLPTSLALVGIGWTTGVFLGWLAGAAAGWRRASFWDRALGALATVGRTMPQFFLASLAIYIGGAWLGLFPLSGAATTFAHFPSLAARSSDYLHHLALPALVVAVPVAVGQFSVVRAATLCQRGAPRLLAARLRGVSQSQLGRWHVLPQTVPAMASLAGIQIAGVIGGLTVVETAFAYPGVGQLMVEAIRYRDYPLIQACFVCMALIALTGSAIAEAVVRHRDPRRGAGR